jgi:hypothetical protein
MSFWTPYAPKKNFWSKYEPEEPDELEASVTTQDISARPLDQGAPRGLSAIVEGGLRAAKGMDVPAELAQGIKRGEDIDVREQTNVTGPGSPSFAEQGYGALTSKAASAFNRFVEGLRRSDDFLAEGRAGFVGLGEDVRGQRPQLATEDRRVVAPASGLLESGIDLVGEIAPEAAAAIATGGLTGASKAITQALPGAGRNLATRVGARVGADTALGTAENFVSAGRVPTVGTVGATAGFSLAFQAIPGGARIAKKLAGSSDEASVIWRSTLQKGDEHAAEILKSTAKEADAAPIPIKTGDPLPEVTPTPSTSSGDDFSFDRLAREVGEEADEEFGAQVLQDPERGFQRQVTPQDAGELSGGTSFQGLRQLAAERGATLDIAEDGISVVLRGEGIPEQRFGNFAQARAAIDELGADTVETAVANSIRGVAEDADDITTKAFAGEPTQQGRNRLAAQVASLPDEVAREKFVRAVAGADGNIEMAMMGDPIKAAREGLSIFGAFKSKFKELYVNALLTNPGTHMVNNVSNLTLLPTRAVVQSVETGMGIVARGAKSLGLLPEGEIFNAMAARGGLRDLAQAFKGYAEGLFHFDGLMREVGHNARMRRAIGQVPLTETEAGNWLNASRMQDEGFLGAMMDRLSAGIHVLLNDGGDDVVRALDRQLSDKTGGRVGLGGLAEDVAVGTGAAGKAIKGKKGSLIRSSTQALQTADAFFKDMLFHSEYNFAKQRLMGQAGITEDILMATPNTLTKEQNAAKQRFLDNAARLASQKARFSTFTSELGEFGKTVVELRNKADDLMPVIPIGTMLSPFMNTPVNILKYTGRHSPVGLVQAGYMALRGPKGAQEASQIVERIAQGSVGTILMGGVGYLINQGVIEVEGSFNQGPQSRTAELASGGQIRNYSLVGQDGSRWRLNRFGPVGLMLGATADTLGRMEEMVLERLEQAEKDAARGAISDTELAEIREVATNDSFFSQLGFLIKGSDVGEGAVNVAEQGLGAVGSVLANNIYNETALADAVRALEELAQSTRRNDPRAFQGAIDNIEKRVATAAQPVAAINSISQALDPTAITPDPDKNFAGRVFERAKGRIPGLTTEGTTQVDILGQARQNRFTGDTSKTKFGRVLGKLFSPFGGKTPEFVGDPRRDRATEIGKEMERLEVYKDFPRVPTTVTDKYGHVPSGVTEQIQVLRGQFRFTLIDKFMDSDRYKRASGEPEKQAKMVEAVFRKADTASAKVVNGHLAKQARAGVDFDVGEIRDSLKDRFDLDIPGL